MLQNLIPTLSEIDTRVLILLAAVAVVLFVVSLIKKAVKIAVFLLVLALLFGGGVPVIKNVKENYGVSYSKQTETLTLKVAGKEFNLPLKELKEAKNYKIRLAKGDKTTKIELFYQRADGITITEQGSNAVEIPNYMFNLLKKYLDGNGLRYTVDDSSDAGGVLPD